MLYSKVDYHLVEKLLLKKVFKVKIVWLNSVFANIKVVDKLLDIYLIKIKRNFNNIKKFSEIIIICGDKILFKKLFKKVWNNLIKHLLICKY